MTEQLTRSDLAGMTPEQIVTAHDTGRLDVLLGGDATDADLTQRAMSGSVTAAETRRLAELGRHDLIARAHTEGRITNRDTEEHA